MISIIILMIALINFALFFYIVKELQRAFMNHEKRIVNLEMEVRLWLPPNRKEVGNE